MLCATCATLLIFSNFSSSLENRFSRRIRYLSSFIVPQEILCTRRLVWLFVVRQLTKLMTERMTGNATLKGSSTTKCIAKERTKISFIIFFLPRDAIRLCLTANDHSRLKEKREQNLRQVGRYFWFSTSFARNRVWHFPNAFANDPKTII